MSKPFLTRDFTAQAYENGWVDASQGKELRPRIIRTLVGTDLEEEYYEDYESLTADNIKAYNEGYASYYHNIASLKNMRPNL